MKPTVTPEGFYRVDLWKGCYLLLTAQEYYNGLKRAKTERRREDNERRQQQDGSILDAINGQRKP